MKKWFTIALFSFCLFNYTWASAAGYWASNAKFVVNGINSPILRSAVVSPIAAGAGHIAGGTTANLFGGQSLNEAFLNSFKGIGQSMLINGAIGVGTTIAVSYASGINPLNGKPLSIRNRTDNADYNFSKAAEAHQDDPNRRVPMNVLDDAIKNGVPSIDPQGSRATIYKIPMFKNGNVYILEVLYDSQTNSIWHFKYY